MGAMKSIAIRIEEICRLCNSSRVYCKDCEILLSVPKGRLIISGHTKKKIRLEHRK